MILEPGPLGLVPVVCEGCDGTGKETWGARSRATIRLRQLRLLNEVRQPLVDALVDDEAPLEFDERQAVRLAP
jgi:hypothetical protein